MSISKKSSFIPEAPWLPVRMFKFPFYLNTETSLQWLRVTVIAEELFLITANRESNSVWLKV